MRLAISYHEFESKINFYIYSNIGLKSETRPQYDHHHSLTAQQGRVNAAYTRGAGVVVSSIEEKKSLIEKKEASKQPHTIGIK